jgi:hypothetical protein
LPVAVVGSGGHATVYEAVDTRFELPVAVKVLADNHAGNVDMRERFLREAAVQRRLPGPLVPVYDIGETPSGQPFIVMPLAQGGDLAARVARWRRWNRPTLDDISALAAVLAETLGALHAIGVVHRDLKPSNLLIFGPSSTPKGSEDALAGQALLAPTETLLLADLGFAKDLRDRSGLTVGGGTRGFLPPEQETQGVVTEKADLWAASAIVFWFCVGQPPPEGPAAQRAALGESGVDPGLAGAVLAGLASDPAERPASMQDWHSGLRVALSQAVRPTVDVGGSGRSLPGSRAVILAVLAVVASVAVAGASLQLAGGLFGRPAGSSDVAATPRTTVEDGRATRVLTTDGASVTVVGPVQIGTGETATFEAVTEGVVDFRWVGPSGRVEPGGEALTILAGAETGTGAVSLAATLPDGTVLVVEAPFEVVD